MCYYITQLISYVILYNIIRNLEKWGKANGLIAPLLKYVSGSTAFIKTKVHGR